MVCTRSSSQALFQLLDSPRKKQLLFSLVKKQKINPKPSLNTIPASFRSVKRVSTAASPAKPRLPARNVHANHPPPASAPISATAANAVPDLPPVDVLVDVDAPEAIHEAADEEVPGVAAAAEEDFIPPPPNPPAPLNFVPSGQHLRDLLQMRWLARQAVEKLGEAAVNDLVAAVKYPIPTVKRVFMEELHSKWIADGEFGKFEVRADGTFIRAVGFVDDSIVRTEELNQMLWVPTYPNLENVLRVEDFTEE